MSFDIKFIRHHQKTRNDSDKPHHSYDKFDIKRHKHGIFYDYSCSHLSWTLKRPFMNLTAPKVAVYNIPILSNVILLGRICSPSIKRNSGSTTLLWLIYTPPSSINLLASTAEYKIQQYELAHMKLVLITKANSEGSDQHAHPRSLARASAVRSINGTRVSFRQRAGYLAPLDACAYMLEGSQTRQCLDLFSHVSAQLFLLHTE